jgi:hypothetical protein
MSNKPPHIKAAILGKKPVKVGYSSYQHTTSSVFSENLPMIRSFGESIGYAFSFCFAVIEPVVHPCLTYNDFYYANNFNAQLFTVTSNFYAGLAIGPLKWHPFYVSVHPFCGGYTSSYDFVSIANTAFAPIYLNRFLDRAVDAYPAGIPNQYIQLSSDFSVRSLYGSDFYNFSSLNTVSSLPSSLGFLAQQNRERWSGQFITAFFNCVYFSAFPDANPAVTTVSAANSFEGGNPSSGYNVTTVKGAFGPLRYKNNLRAAASSEAQGESHYFSGPNVTTQTLLRDFIPEQTVRDVTQIFSRSSYLSEQEWDDYYDNGGDPASVYTVTTQEGPTFTTLDHLKPSIIFLQEIRNALADKSSNFKGSAVNSTASSRCSEMFFVIDLSILGIDYSALSNNLTIVVSNPGVFVRINSSNICYTYASASSVVSSSKRYIYVSFWYLPYLQESFNEIFPSGTHFQSENVWDSYGKVGSLGSKVQSSVVGDLSTPPIDKHNFTFDFCIINGIPTSEVLDNIDPFNVNFSVFTNVIYSTADISGDRYNHTVLNALPSVKAFNMSVFFPNYLPLQEGDDYTYSAELYKDFVYTYGGAYSQTASETFPVQFPEPVYKKAFKPRLGPFRPAYATTGFLPDRLYIQSAETNNAQVYPPFPAYIPPCFAPPGIDFSDRALVSQYSHRYSCEIPFQFHWEFSDQSKVTPFLNSLYVYYYVTNYSSRAVYFRKSGSSTYYSIPAYTSGVYVGTATTRAYRRSYSSQFSNFEHASYEDTAGYRPVSPYPSSAIALNSRCYFTCLALYRSYIYIPPYNGSIQPTTNVPGDSSGDVLTIPNPRFHVIVSARISTSNPADFNNFDPDALSQSYSISANVGHYVKGTFDA